MQGKFFHLCFLYEETAQLVLLNKQQGILLVIGRIRIQIQVDLSSRSAIFLPFNTLPSLFSTVSMINNLDYDEFYSTQCFRNSCCFSLEEIRILSNYPAVNFNKFILGKNYKLQNLLLFNMTQIDTEILQNRSNLLNSDMKYLCSELLSQEFCRNIGASSSLAAYWEFA